jgi:hypothetical protein
MIKQAFRFAGNSGLGLVLRFPRKTYDFFKRFEPIMIKNRIAVWTPEKVEALTEETRDGLSISDGALGAEQEGEKFVWDVDQLEIEEGEGGATGTVSEGVEDEEAPATGTVSEEETLEERTLVQREDLSEVMMGGKITEELPDYEIAGGVYTNPVDWSLLPRNWARKITIEEGYDYISEDDQAILDGRDPHFQAQIDDIIAPFGDSLPSVQRHAAPIHPGTGTDQSVHDPTGGGGKFSKGQRVTFTNREGKKLEGFVDNVGVHHESGKVVYGFAPDDEGELPDWGYEDQFELSSSIPPKKKKKRKKRKLPGTQLEREADAWKQSQAATIRDKIARLNDKIDYGKMPEGVREELRAERDRLERKLAELTERHASPTHPGTGSDQSVHDPRKKDHSKPFRESGEKHTAELAKIGIKPGDRFTDYSGQIWQYTKSNYTGVPYFVKVNKGRVGKTEFVVPQFKREFAKRLAEGKSEPANTLESVRSSIKASGIKGFRVKREGGIYAGYWAVIRPASGGFSEEQAEFLRQTLGGDVQAGDPNFQIKLTKRHASPIHPGTGSDQSVHAGDGGGEKAPWRLTRDDLVKLPKPLSMMPKKLSLPDGREFKTYMGNIHVKNEWGDILGNLYRVGAEEKDGKMQWLYEVWHVEHGKRLARLPGRFWGSDLERLPPLRLSASKEQPRFRFKRPADAVERHGDHIDQEGRSPEAGGSKPGYTHADGGAEGAEEADGAGSEASIRKVVNELAEELQITEEEIDDIVNTAVELRQEAVDDEPALTSMMEELAKKFGGKLKGLEFRIKTGESLAEKIVRGMVQKGLTLEEAKYQSTYDSNRYTIALDPKTMVDDALQLQSDLAQRGWTEYDHKWTNYYRAGDAYDGYNMVFIHGKTGKRFELQLHTPESYEIKNKVWPDYKLMRSPATPEEKRASLFQRMVAEWKNYTKPVGWEKLPGVVKSERPVAGVRYFARIIDDPDSPRYKERVSLHRWEHSEAGIRAEWWDTREREWVDDPALVGFTGIGGGNDYEEITLRQAHELFRKLQKVPKPKEEPEELEKKGLLTAVRRSLDKLISEITKTMRGN